MVLWIFWECWVWGPSGFGEYCKPGGPSRFVESCGLDGSGWASLLILAISGYLLAISSDVKLFSNCSLVFDDPKELDDPQVFTDPKGISISQNRL